MLKQIMSATMIAATLMTGSAVLSAAPVGGARVGQMRVGAYNTRTFNPITFVGGEQAAVVVQGDGDTELHLRVYDAGNHLIDDDTCQTDRCVALFTPRWTGDFTISVENLGSVYNDVEMATD
jgi:hypothetical protein